MVFLYPYALPSPFRAEIRTVWFPLQRSSSAYNSGDVNSVKRVMLGPKMEFMVNNLCRMESMEKRSLVLESL